MYVVRLTSGRWKLELFLVLIPCISEFIWNNALLFTINNKWEKMYCDISGKIPTFLNNCQQESLVYFSLFPTWYTVFPSTYNICYPLSSKCFRPHRPIIRRSKLYMQPMVFSPSADVFVVQPLRKSLSSFSTAARQRRLQRGRIP